MNRFNKIILCIIIVFTFGNIIYAYNDINITAGHFPIRINGVKQALTTFNIDDNTYVSLRQLCDQIGVKVDWNEKERTIELNTDDELHIKEGLGFPLPTSINQDTALKIANSLFEQYVSKETLSKYEWSVEESTSGEYYKICLYQKGVFGGQLGVLISKTDGKILGFGIGD